MFPPCAVASFDSGDEGTKAVLSVGDEDVPGTMLGKEATWGQ